MKPDIYFSQSIDERSWRVWRPVVKIGEHRGFFFFYVDTDDADARELIAPPRGLYGKEFLTLDHRNPFQLMEFQRRWGPITGLRARPNKTFDYGTYPNVAPNDSFYESGQNSVFHSDGIMQTMFLYEGMGESDIIVKERFGIENRTLGKVVHENWRKSHEGRRAGVDIVPCHVASVEEVAEAVCDAQVAIRAVTRILENDYTESEWEHDKRLVHESVRYCNAVLSGSIDPVDIIEGGGRDGVCTLMQYLFICLVKGIMLNNAYRFCQNPDCRRLFTPREYGRRADSRYCCDECQIKAKYLRTFKKGKKTRVASQSLDERTEAPAIEVEWSTSNIPVRTLRRDQVKLPGDERDAVSGSETEQRLLYVSFSGLSTGRPRTESILDELKSKEALT